MSLLAGCLRDAAPPNVGDCAEYPDGIYEFGQIGIGTCLSGPTDIVFRETPDGELTLLVSNANPYQLFTTGSLLAIPWDEVDLSMGRNVITDMNISGLALEDFAGPIALVDEGQTAMVGVRFSEDARTRIFDDSIYLIDVSDPADLQPARRGPNGQSTVTVESDPIDVEYYQEQGLAFVANRTDHTISVLTADADEIQVIRPWPNYAISGALFSDPDGSGSTAELADLIETITDDLIDETWTLTWIEGSWRLWLPEDGALNRQTTSGGGVYVDSARDLELNPEDFDAFSEVVDPHYLNGAGQMIFADDGDLLLAGTDSSQQWVVGGTLLVAQDGETLSGPAVISDGGLRRMFFTVTDVAGETAIEEAFSGDGLSYSRQSGQLLIPGRPHDIAGIRQPFVFLDSQTDQWRMYYSAFDGERWTIGHAVSDDLETWTADEAPILALDGADVAAPAVSSEVGLYRMWFSRDDGEGWIFWSAESPDGLNWEIIEPISTEPIADLDPPRVALQASPSAAFRIEGQQADPLVTRAFPGSTVITEYGWAATALAGARLSPGDAGARSAGGIRVGSVIPEDGLAWLTITSAGGISRIGLAYIEEDGQLIPLTTSVFDPASDGFDAGEVFSPVVWKDGETYTMAYAGQQSVNAGLTSIGLATSTDGITWERQGQIQESGGQGDSTWDGLAAVPASVEVISDGVIRLWYAGDDEDRWRIGALISEDGGKSWRRDGADPLFSPGAAGDWDDDGVRHPFVLRDETGQHLWYAGDDGDIQRIGYAFRSDDDSPWQRSAEPVTDEPRPVLDEVDGLFHPSGVNRPVVHIDEAGEIEMWFGGLYNGTVRVGRAVGQDVERLYKTPLRPTVNDTLSFETERGDAQANAIPLDDLNVEEIFNDVFAGFTSIDLDEERGFLYAVSKLIPLIIVIDVRDDSDGDFRDLNYLDIEAVFTFDVTNAESGFRQVEPVPGSDRLYAVNDDPESIMILDATELVDDAYPQLIYDAQLGALPAPPSSRDEGVTPRSRVGPGDLIAHPDGERLFVSNFNANTVTVYDLTLGPVGSLIAEVTDVGENPYGMTLTPDGRHLVFGNYSGEVDNQVLTESTIAVLDVDPDSPTYLSVLTWIANQ